MAIAPARRRILILSAVALADFALRIAVVRPGSFQFSDGIRLMDWGIAQESKVQPLYPALVHAVRQAAGDPVLAAALVAGILGALAVFPLFDLARRLHGEGAGWWAVALYSTNLAVFVQGAGPTANSLFVFCFLMAARALAPPRDPAGEGAAKTGAFLFWSGCAALARPEGLLLWPACLIVLAGHLRRRRPAAWTLPAAALPFAFWACWNLGLRPGFEYGEEIRIGANLATPAKFLKYLLAYLADFSRGLLHVYATIAAWGLVISLRERTGRADRRAWHLLLLYSLVGVLAVLALHWAYVPRLLAPLIVLALVPAGLALQRAAARSAVLRWAAVLLIAITFAFGAGTVATLYRNLAGIGGDIRAGAEALPALADEGEAVVSDLPVETAYYSGLSVGFYIREMAGPGTLVVLHNIQTDLAAERQALAAMFTVTPLAEHTAPYISPRRGGIPVATGGVRMMDLSERERPLSEEPYRTVIWRLDPRGSGAPLDLPSAEDQPGP